MTTMTRKAAISGMLGNGLEWYDYALYGHMALIFSQLFFPPTDSASTNIILTYLTFAVGFVARPVGAVLFGYIGDKYGRKKALVASMILMAIPTGGIGLLPTYEMVGILAPILLLSLRVLQGLSLGGAFSGTMSYVVEHAPSDRRASVGCVTVLSLVIGFLAGSLVSSLVASSMSEADFMSWGWRLPFFVGILIGFVGFWIRNHGEESPVYKEAKESGALSDSPVKEVFLKHPFKMFQGFNAYLFVTVPFYMLAIYMIGYSKTQLGLTQEEALQINSMAMLAMFVPIIPASRMADRIGRRAVLLIGIVAMMIVVYPAFQMMQEAANMIGMSAGSDLEQMAAVRSEAFMKIAIAQCLLAFISGWYISPIPALLVELFPTRVRYTGMALAYNFCAILGGFTPAICAWLITRTGDKTSIMYLLIGAAFVSFVSLFFYKDRWREKLA